VKAILGQTVRVSAEGGEDMAKLLLGNVIAAPTCTGDGNNRFTISPCCTLRLYLYHGGQRLRNAVCGLAESGRRTASVGRRTLAGASALTIILFSSAVFGRVERISSRMRHRRGRRVARAAAEAATNCDGGLLLRQKGRATDVGFAPTAVTVWA